MTPQRDIDLREAMAQQRPYCPCEVGINEVVTWVLYPLRITVDNGQRGYAFHALYVRLDGATERSFVEVHQTAVADRCSPCQESSTQLAATVCGRRTRIA